MEENINKPQNEQITISKKNLYVILGVLAAVVIAGIAYFSLRNKAETTPEKDKKDSISIGKDSIKVKTDSVAVVDSTKSGDDEFNEEEGPYYYPNKVIATSITLPTGQLKFGDQVFVDESLSNDTEKVVYLQDPWKVKNQPSFKLKPEVLVGSYEFDKYVKNFSLSPFSELPVKVKLLILNSSYFNGKDFSVTQNASRAKSTLAIGDYDADGVKDVAIVLDNNEHQYSRFLIICTNKSTKQPYLAYSQEYSDKMKIRNMKKSDVLFESPEMEKNSHHSGIILQSENYTEYLLYNFDLQKFKGHNPLEPSATADDE